MSLGLLVGPDRVDVNTMNTRNAGKRGLEVSRSGTSHPPRCQGADSFKTRASRDLDGCQKNRLSFRIARKASRFAGWFRLIDSCADRHPSPTSYRRTPLIIIIVITPESACADSVLCEGCSKGAEAGKVSTTYDEHAPMFSEFERI